MGSVIEINDTLQLTTEQGFPKELDHEKYKDGKLTLEDITEKVFSFNGKPGIRIYQAPPVRNFLVHNIDGKWLYWGLVHILNVTHDHETNTTSGKFKIIYLYTPNEMKLAHDLIDRDPKTNFFHTKTIDKA